MLLQCINSKVSRLCGTHEAWAAHLLVITALLLALQPITTQLLKLSEPLAMVGPVLLTCS
jgi:hypothetical protein